MVYNPRDYYFKKAKSENYAARSVFKLDEIDQKFRILKSGQKVLDLGAAPGSWSQLASKKVGPTGRVLGLDLQVIKITLPNAVFIAADMRQTDLEQIMKAHEMSPPFDLVLSDMAPKTTGIRITDQARSLELCEIALETAKKYLKKGGTFVCKLFHSEDFEAFRAHTRLHFEKVEVLRPQKYTQREQRDLFRMHVVSAFDCNLKSWLIANPISRIDWTPGTRRSNLLTEVTPEKIASAEK